MLDRAYSSYVTRTAPAERDLLLMRQRLSTFDDLPKISVLLALSDPDEVWIKASLSSVLNGTYPRVELCVCDNASERPHVRETLEEFAASDERVKIRRLSQPASLGRAFNAALSRATGRFVMVLGEGDELAPEALFRVVELLRNVEADVVYADEDRVDVGDRRSNPVFKPYWSPDLLLSTMYVGRPCLIRSNIVEDIGGFREDFGGAAEHDLMLRVAERTSRIHHLPGVSYHRRVYESESVPTEQGSQEAARRAVEEALDRRAVEAAVEPGPDSGSVRVVRSLAGEPTVSVVTLATEATVAKGVPELEQSTAYPVHEVIPAEVGKDAVPGSVNVTPAKAANLAAGKATGEYLLFLRDFGGAASRGWLVELLRQAQRTEVGAVGARVADDNGNARYAGSFVDLSMLLSSSPSVFPPEQTTRYLPVLDHPFNPYAISADCMMVRRSVFEEAGGFDEGNLPMTFYDLDFSLRLRERGLINVYAPEAGVVSSTDRPLPSVREIQWMWERWWLMLVKALSYRDTPLRTEENNRDSELLSLVSASV